MGGRSSSSGMINGSGSTIGEYGLAHRPGNPLEYPDEVATVDKILDGGLFPSDLLNHPNQYFADYGDYGEEAQLINTLRRAQNNPDMMVTIYRGAPSGGDLNQGDWVTLSRKYAMAYADGGAYSDNPNSRVYAYKVRVGDLSFDGDSIYEYGYWGKKLGNGKRVR